MSHQDSSARRQPFQAEVSQLLKLLSGALYSNRDVFLRELVSNAFDAIEKRRLASVQDASLGDADAGRIVIRVKPEERVIEIEDNGIGMSEQELIEHLGTIAQSGTKAFMERMSSGKANAGQLIGQFGVGFYSSFVVADQVTVLSKRFDEDQAWLWSSDGVSDYTLEPAERAEAGVTVTLHLKEDAKEYLETWKVKQVVTKYSDHISVPVVLEAPQDDEDGDDDQETVINQASALWVRSKSDISDEQYQDFYKHITHDYEDALLWSHQRVEGKTQYTSLLYIPKHATFELWQREFKRGLKLYVRRVFIMDEAEQLLPNYLRFVKGLVDTDDLPLNVSRELLQTNRVVETIRAGVIKRVLGLLKQAADKQPDVYQSFWDAFGQVLKEGPGEDFVNKDAIVPLLRFATTHDDLPAQTHSLDAIIERMPEHQSKIYYCIADSFSAAKHSPHLEYFRRKGIEVLLLSDRVDEWLIAHLSEYQGKTFQAVTKGDLEAQGDEQEAQAEKEHLEAASKSYEGVLERVQAVLKDTVKEVRLTQRLTDSPACLVAGDEDLSNNLRRMLQEAGQAVPESKLILELNPDHRLCERLRDEQVESLFEDMCHVLHDQALLAEGGSLSDPAAFVKRMNALLMG